ncbi:MAG: MBL fold metallo-hydrolase RNA specificity domain-containing protein [Micavibrio sp.]
MKLTFLGAAGTVTGSKYLVEYADQKILVDCGLFQGQKELRQMNWDGLPLSPMELDAVLLTHAHIDHSGYIPKLVKEGFKGPVYCSSATYDLCKILLPDSGYLQEEDAYAANHYGWSQHQPALPLYTKDDAEACLSSFQIVELGHPHYLKDDLRFTLHRAGHILGANFIRLANDAASILFSGDVGRLHNPVIKPPAHIQDADFVVVESTYGDRLHKSDDPTDEIEKIALKTIRRGGSLIIPAFAVGRAQSLLYHFYLLKQEGRIPDVPIFLDSPMAIKATDLLQKHMNDHRLSPEECDAVCSVATYVSTSEESRAINMNHNNGMPKIIISASGMATGGRILHHLKYYAGDSRNTIMLVGFQAAGTRGDRLARGEKELKIHGQMWDVNAEVVSLDSMSSHADYNEILAWLSGMQKPPRTVFITHGEKEAAQSLGDKIIERFGWNTCVPELGQQEDIL